MDGNLIVTVSEFKALDNERSPEVEGAEMKHPVFIVPFQFCAMRPINDPKYLPDEKDYGKRVIGRRSEEIE